MSKHGRHNQARMIAKTLRIGWQQRPAATSMFLFGAALETSSFVGTLYASAKLSALLAHYVTAKSTADIWQWLFIDIACGIGIALGFWLMTWAMVIWVVMEPRTYRLLMWIVWLHKVAVSLTPMLRLLLVLLRDILYLLANMLGANLIQISLQVMLV